MELQSGSDILAGLVLVAIGLVLFILLISIFPAITGFLWVFAFNIFGANLVDIGYWGYVAVGVVMGLLLSLIKTVK